MMAGPYRNPFRKVRGLVTERVDQGQDFSAPAGQPIYAIGAGTVVATQNAGWPGGTFIAIRLEQGPYAGHYVYFAEDIKPEVQVGQHVDTNTIIGRFTGGSSGIETGWAAPPPNIGESLAHAMGQTAFPTPEGLDFSKLLHSLGVKSTTPGPPGPLGPSQAAGCITGMLALPLLPILALWRRR